MNGFGGWFRQLTAKMSAALRNFMVGRYGTDRLNMVILSVGLVQGRFQIAGGKGSSTVSFVAFHFCAAIIPYPFYGGAWRAR